MIDLLRERGISLDVCPISNLKLGIVPSPDRHPIRQLLDAGIPCTLSTDDPISFGNTLEDEYLFLATHLGFSHQDLATVARNGFCAALVSEEWRTANLAMFLNFARFGAL